MKKIRIRSDNDIWPLIYETIKAFEFLSTKANNPSKEFSIRKLTTCSIFIRKKSISRSTPNLTCKLMREVLPLLVYFGVIEFDGNIIKIK